MNVVPSNAVDCVLMFVVAVAMVAHTFGYRSQLVTGLAFLLAFSTIALSQDTVYALVAGVILALGIALIALRMSWFELEVFGIIASEPLLLVIQTLSRRYGRSRFSAVLVEHHHPDPLLGHFSHFLCGPQNRFVTPGVDFDGGRACQYHDAARGHEIPIHPSGTGVLRCDCDRRAGICLRPAACYAPPAHRVCVALGRRYAVNLCRRAFQIQRQQYRLVVDDCRRSAAHSGHRAARKSLSAPGPARRMSDRSIRCL